MDILSLTSTVTLFPISTTSNNHRTAPSPSPTAGTITSATSASFSLKSPPPIPPPEPLNPIDSSLRRPDNSLKPTSPGPKTPKLSKNPLKPLLAPRITSSTLSAKLRLSSKLSPPLPPPQPLRPLCPAETQALKENPVEHDQENKALREEFRQEGKIFVGNIPNWIKKHELSEFFRQFGPIKSVILIKGHNVTERNAGFGFIIYGGPTAETSAMKAVEFDGVEFHGRVLTVKLDDGKKLKTKMEERRRWVQGQVGEEYRSKWHEERDGSRKAFRRVLDTQPENWQRVVSAFERIDKV